MRGLVVLAIVVIFSGAAGCRNADPTPAEAPTGLPVEVVTARRGPIRDRISLIGTLQPWEQVLVFSKTPGKLLRNLVQEGDRVAKDATLALVDRDETGVEFQPAPVESSAEGVIGKLFLDPGAAVSPVQPVAMVVNLKRIKAVASVIEMDLARVREGQGALVRVEAYPGKEFSGRLRRVSPLVDPASRTTTIEIEMDNAGEKLRPGMFARIDLIVGKKEKALVLPKTAVLHKKGLCLVFVASGDAADMREVRLGYDDLDRYEILEGLNEGEQVIVSSLSILHEGNRVRVQRP